MKKDLSYANGRLAVIREMQHFLEKEIDQVTTDWFGAKDDGNTHKTILLSGIRRGYKKIFTKLETKKQHTLKNL